MTTSLRNFSITALVAAAALAAAAPRADAAVTSATIAATTATLTFDGADDSVNVTVEGGFLRHGITGAAGLASALDWDSATGGEQKVPADASFTVVLSGGDGADTLTVTAATTEIAKAVLNGDGGNDLLTGARTADDLRGGDGNDRVVGFAGGDDMEGGNGNDTLVWNNGDGSDVMDGDAGNDGIEVNGAATAADTFTIVPSATRVDFDRTNLVPFSLDIAAERLEVNGLGGNDSATASGALAALIGLTLNGGVGVDTLTGADGADLIAGGEENDVLAGGGGDDRVLGDRGNDTMRGGAGDDTLVWNNGDGTDVMDGDDGRDTIEVNGATGAGDVFSVLPAGDRIDFDRTNLGPFSLDIGTSEAMSVNGLGGDDSIVVDEVGAFAVTAAGGAGNDTLTGKGAAETLLGGSGNDTLLAGPGSDVVSGDDGDDTIAVRDGWQDFVRCGAGSDSVSADAASVDVGMDGCESIDRPAADPVVVPPPPAPAPVVTPTTPEASALAPRIGGPAARVRNGVATIRLTCPAAASEACTGVLTLTTIKRAGYGARQIGRIRYDIAAGTTKSVRVRLAKGAARLATRAGKLTVRAQATVDGTGARATSARRVTLDFGRAAKR